MNSSERRADVAIAGHVLAAHDILDAFGHVSARAPDDNGRFLIPRSMAPALVTVDDVIELDLDGNAVTGANSPLFLERFIHSEIYRLRPDVGAIVHSHAPAVLPFTVVQGIEVKPICHMCGFLKGTPPPFDVAHHSGSATDLLIRSTELGRALAAHLGPASVVLMRGHGFTAVGRDIPEATYRAIYAARNCEIVLKAMALGTPIYLSDGEAETCEATTSGQINRAWSLWRRDVSSGQTV